MGEEIGWLVSPFLNGFYYGYMATGDTKWIDLLVDWADAVDQARREGAGRLHRLAQGRRGQHRRRAGLLPPTTSWARRWRCGPMVLMAGEILKTPALKDKYGRKAEEYIQLWPSRSSRSGTRAAAWREVKDGGVWVVPPFGIDQKTGKWTDGYEQRNTDGFSLPANKQNLIALLAAGHVRRDEEARLPRAGREVVAGDEVAHAGSREDGKYFVWNYWDPAGPWDYKPDGSLKHWVGVHPNGGYYGIDVEGIVTAYEHGLVFTKEDIDRLIATNRDFMWNKQVQGAKFQRIDGGEPDQRWAKSPGVLWTALAPYDETLRKVFEANHNPGRLGRPERHAAVPGPLRPIRPHRITEDRLSSGSKVGGSGCGALATRKGRADRDSGAGQAGMNTISKLAGLLAITLTSLMVSAEVTLAAPEASTSALGRRAGDRPMAVAADLGQAARRHQVRHGRPGPA